MNIVKLILGSGATALGSVKLPHTPTVRPLHTAANRLSRSGARQVSDLPAMPEYS